MIRVVCACGRAFKAEDRHAGKQTKCPECGAGLTIGPAPNSSPSGGGVAEVPSWWYPSDPTNPASRGTAPTRSGSDPGPDAANTMVLPAGYDPNPKPQASSQSPLAAAPNRAQVSPPRAPVGAHVQAPWRRSFPVKKSWAIFSGSIALLALAVGAILWVRPATPVADDVSPAPRGAELDKPDDSGPGGLSPPSVPGRNPRSSENKTAGTPTGDASPSGPQVDLAGQPKPAPASPSRRLRLLVPTYIYPRGDGRKEWQRLFDAASKVEIVAIANPNSGPGDELNPDYTAIFTEATNQGVTLVGYVSTDFGKRTQAEIKQDVDTWVRYYPQIRGFFFDQQPREGRYVVHFAELRDYARQKLRDPLVITNPGVPCDEAYLAQAVSDVTCVFVNYQGFEQFEPPATFKAYDPSRFAAMPYNISDVETMRTVVKDAIIKRIGYLYISDAKPPNQWGKLPVYWEAEVDAVSRLP
jgi:spherulation-specific family 4 protein